MFSVIIQFQDTPGDGGEGLTASDVGSIIPGGWGHGLLDVEGGVDDNPFS